MLCTTAVRCGCGASEPAAAADRTLAFPRGWNGMAPLPPMGWRSWSVRPAAVVPSARPFVLRAHGSCGPAVRRNSFGNHINQSIIVEAGHAMVKKRFNNTSLLDLGYDGVGIDEGWEGCGEGVNHTQHGAGGRPTVDISTFGDLTQLVANLHQLGLRAGWYLNGIEPTRQVQPGSERPSSRTLTPPAATAAVCPHLSHMQGVSVAKRGR
jgi:hypothetical protein